MRLHKQAFYTTNKKKIDKAKKYFHLAADTHSHIIAAINLAAIYGNDEDNRKKAKKYYHLAADVPIDTMKSVYSFFGGKELYELNKQKLMQTKISARHNLVHIYTLEGNVAKANEYQQKLKK